jgi:hypothetical protein
MSKKNDFKLTGVAAYSIGNQNVRHGNHFWYLKVGLQPQLSSALKEICRKQLVR